MKNIFKAILFITVFFTLNSLMAQIGPGSGRAANFSGTNYINIPNSSSFLHSSNNLSVEAWINPSAYTTGSGTASIIAGKVFTNQSREYFYYLSPTGQLVVSIFDNSNTNYEATSTKIISLNTWSHVSFSYNGSTGIISIYINGVLDSNTSVGIVTIAQTSINPVIGAYWLSGNTVRDYFLGLIDEVRIWDVVRSQAQIQSAMCHNLIGNETGLNAYYTFDETSGTIANDLTGNANTATLVSFPAVETNNRSYSGAPVGNASVSYYSAQPASWSGQTFTLNSITPSPASVTNPGSISIDNITGTPDGIHIYRVNPQPSQPGGLSKPVSAYYGTFVANVNTPSTAFSYATDYSYSSVNNSNCDLGYKLKTRNDNSVTTWVDTKATNNTTNSILTDTNNIIRQEFILDTICPVVQVGPGSGRAANFSGTDYINIPNSASFLHNSNNLSVEAWINPSSYMTGSGTASIIVGKVYTNQSREYFYYLSPAGQLIVSLFDNSNTTYGASSTKIISLNTWTHVSFTYNGSTGILNIYINGVLDTSANVGIVTIAQTNINPVIGAYWLSSNTVRDYFTGLIDEVRIWDVVRTQAQIQSAMCHNLVGNETGLDAYYTFDETSGTIANDLTGNANTATLVSFPALETNNRSYSGAPIGNSSISYYSTQPANWSGQTYSLNPSTPTSSSNVGYLSINNITGTPDGIHIYRVNTPPSQSTGLKKPVSAYYGTFIANVNTPSTAFSYEALYNYSSILVNNSIVSDYTLKTRNDNSIATWTSLGASNNTTNSVLTDANNSFRREFMLDTATSITTATLNPSDKSIIRIYPNPSTGLVHFDTPENGQLFIYNTLGQMVVTQKLSKDNSSLDLSYLTTGMYTLVFNGQNNSYTPVKWIKE